ncbi:hypothetical protein O3P69_017793 [Scylla paramamosain]|uniref:Uncharacterized protein n=1 Tax=Scylla paramamosain TaxID=85552 RepID=A0AAW0SIX9_SCYPA
MTRSSQTFHHMLARTPHKVASLVRCPHSAPSLSSSLGEQSRHHHSLAPSLVTAVICFTMLTLISLPPDCNTARASEVLLKLSSWAVRHAFCTGYTNAKHYWCSPDSRRVSTDVTMRTVHSRPNDKLRNEFACSVEIQGNHNRPLGPC